jgi:hypothetical protein
MVFECVMDRTGGGWEGTALGPFSTAPGARSKILNINYIRIASSPVAAGTASSAIGTSQLCHRH